MEGRSMSLDWLIHQGIDQTPEGIAAVNSEYADFVTQAWADAVTGLLTVSYKQSQPMGRTSLWGDFFVRIVQP
jgi:hypothetical protein